MSAPAADDLDQAEAALNAYLDEYSSSGYPSLSYLARRPVAARAAFELAQRLPILSVAPSSSIEGSAVRRELSRGLVRVRTPLHAVSAAIAIPSDLSQYTQGSSMQTLRRKLRIAERRGISWQRVRDEDDRRALVTLADEHERINPIDRYRAAQPHNEDLFDYDLWMVARDRQGDPVTLAVSPVDRGIGVLRYFRTLVANEDASVARYFLTHALVGELHARGAHHLADTMPSMHLAHGLRHFQRMVGFRLVRLEFAEL